MGEKQQVALWLPHPTNHEFLFFSTDMGYFGQASLFGGLGFFLGTLLGRSACSLLLCNPLGFCLSLRRSSSLGCLTLLLRLPRTNE